MTQPDWNDYEKELIRFLAKHYDEKGKIIEFSEVPHFDEPGQKGVPREIDRLKRYGLLLDFGITGYKIRPAVLEVAHELDNPPPKDYPKQVEPWVRSHWWSILLLGLPALVGYIAMLQALLQWMGILE